MVYATAMESTTYLSSSPVLLLCRADSFGPDVSDTFSCSSSSSSPQPAKSQDRCPDNDSRNRVYEQAEAEAAKVKFEDDILTRSEWEELILLSADADTSN